MRSGHGGMLWGERGAKHSLCAISKCGGTTTTQVKAALPRQTLAADDARRLGSANINSGMVIHIRRVGVSSLL